MGLLSGRWPVSLPSMLPPEFTARLMSRVAMRGADDCWEWTAGKVSAGYGAILLPHSISGAKKAQVPAHRLVCLIFHGPPPDADHFALHLCALRRGGLGVDGQGREQRGDEQGAVRHGGVPGWIEAAA